MANIRNNPDSSNRCLKLDFFNFFSSPWDYAILGLLFFLVLSNGHPEGEEDRNKMLSGVNSTYSSSSNLKNSGGKEIARSELSERFKIFVVNAIEFLIYSGN